MTEEQTLVPHNLPILVWPDEGLTKVCSPVEVFDFELEQLVFDMMTTIRANEAIGLSAVQIGVPKQIICIWIEHQQPTVIINPEVVNVNEDETFEWDEGCLSVPGYYSKRSKPESILIKYQDTDGKIHESEFHGLYAFAIQHELEHLEGKTFVDNLSTFKKSRIKTKIKKILKKQNKNG